MSEGPLISCSWFHDAQFHSPEGFARRVPSFKHQVYQREVRKSQLEVCERRVKSFIKYFKGPMIKMLRRNMPYGNIIYMLRLLENDRKTSFLTDLFSRSRYKGYNFLMEDTRKEYLLSKIVYLRVRQLFSLFCPWQTRWHCFYVISH